MPKSRRFRIALALAFASGCGALGPEVCTLIGCNEHGLFIHFDGPPAQTVRIEATTGEGPLPVIVECTDLRQCSNSIVFPSFFPQHVHLKVTHGQFSREYDFSPTYTTSRPNGPDCDPVCRSGSVTVTLPRN